MAYINIFIIEPISIKKGNNMVAICVLYIIVEPVQLIDFAINGMGFGLGLDGDGYEEILSSVWLDKNGERWLMKVG